MTRLGLRLPYIDGEMPSSFVSRLARLHGSNPRDFCSDMGLRWPDICSGHSDQLSLLAKLADVSTDELIFWSAPLTSPCRYRIGAELASTGAFRRAVTRICPTCVIEAESSGLKLGPFQRLEWLVLSIQVCERHGTPLLRLPNSTYAHYTYDLLAQIDRHRPMIAKASEKAKRLPLTALEQHVLQRIRGQGADDWLAGLELQQLHRACQTLGSALLFGSARRSAALEWSENRAALSEGYDVLQGGPAVLWQAFLRLKAAHQTERPYFSTDMGDFYTWLKEEVDAPNLAELRSVVRSFISENYPLQADHIILGEAIGSVSRLTFDEARHVSGIARARMAKTLAHLRPKGRSTSPVITDVSRHDVMLVEEFWAGLSNLKDAADILGVHPAQMKRLINGGILDAVRMGSALRYVTKASIAQLLRLIAALPVEQENSVLIPIAEFSQSRCVSMAVVLGAIKRKEIHSVYRVEAAHGIRSILIDDAEMPIRKRRRYPEDMSIAEAAEHLRIGAASIRILRDGGFLVQVHRRNPDTNHMRAFITRESMACFEGEYETLGQIAERQCCRAMHLATRLDAEGVEPLYLKGSLVRAYLRQRTDMEAVSVKPEKYAVTDAA